MERFQGTCEKLCGVDRSAIDPLIAWIGSIPLEEWPQQHKVHGQLRPAMVTDPLWYGFRAHVSSIVHELTHVCGATSASNYLLSAVMPDQHIPPHKDVQGHNWRSRIHVPLITHEFAFMVMDKPYHMAVGNAYKINTETTHFIVNMGVVPRIHLMFDVGV